MKRNDLQNRLIDFGVNTTNICEKLPASYTARYLADQLCRSALSPALNYGEAQMAESRKDFIHKMKVCLKELKESEVSLEIISRKNYGKSEEIEKLKGELDQLISIFVKSVQTARKTSTSKINNIHS
ncbi:MAG TPA: four helix bundle protein [Flavobacteriales bacterium]|jgi:four helix bundle protein|nr:four helix bundle protein [Salibacteraceae bacterium]MDA9820135.1 four helix bundle protein [Salibacteraceae bacterium]HAS34950.1 four helix bundle protein [Flavobacteriales bacterium]